MATNDFKKWITIAVLAVAPLASAQSTRAMDEGQKNSVDVALAATPVKTQDEQEIDELRKEIDALRSAVAAQQDRDFQRQQLLGDPTSHPMWP